MEIEKLSIIQLILRSKFFKKKPGTGEQFTIN